MVKMQFSVVTKATKEKSDIELTDEHEYPDETKLKAVLGKSFSAYAALLKLFDKNEIDHEWRFYKDGKAWLCKVQKKKKTIIWMSARKGYIQACIYFPERQVEQVLSLEISQQTKARLQAAQNIGKSRPCLFEVSSTEILADIEKVMNFKMIAT